MERLRRFAPYLLFGALLAVVYADPLFFSRVFTGRDLVAYNYPMEKSVHDAWAEGQLPVWTPEVSGGRPLAPNPNVGAFYPVRILLARLPLAASLRIYPLLHWFAAGAGTICLLSAVGVSPAGAWLGAVTYVFSGVAVSESFYPHIQPGMALLPWILWQVRRARGGRGVIGLAALLALDLAAGDVFTIALGLACAALWIALEMESAEAPRALGRLGAALVLAVVAAAPQIVATALWIPETNRGVLGIRLSEATLYSISPWRLLEFAVPYPFGPMWRLDAADLWGGPVHRYRGIGLFETLYAGALPVIAVFAVWRARMSGLRFGRALLVLALLVSVVPSLLPEAFGSWKAPIALRNPEKFAVAITFAMAIFAARGFDALRLRRGSRWPLGVGLALTAAAAAAALRPRAAGLFATGLIGGTTPFPERAASSLPFALASAGLLWVASLLALEAARRGGRSATAFAVALLTLVPVAAARPIARTASETATLGPTPFARRIARADPAGRYRTLGGEIYRPREAVGDARYGDGWESARQDWVLYTPVLWNRGMVFNYDFDAGDLARVESLRRVSGLAAAFPDAGAFFGAFALRWCVRSRAQPPLPGYHRVGGNAAQDWDEHERPFPDIRLADAWTEETSALDALARIGEIPPGGMVIETGRKGEGRAAPGRLRVLRDAPANLVVETECAEPTWLFVLRAYWTYRRVAVDGREVELAPANLAFTAVPLPAGRHRVDWEELVPGWELSRLGPAVFGFVAAATIVASRRRRAGR